MSLSNLHNFENHFGRTSSMGLTFSHDEIEGYVPEIGMSQKWYCALPIIYMYAKGTWEKAKNSRNQWGIVSIKFSFKKINKLIFFENQFWTIDKYLRSLGVRMQWNGDTQTLVE